MRSVRVDVALGVLLFFTVTVPASAETVWIISSRDATLIEEPGGELANGAGPAFFVGRSNQRQNSVRRGLIYFDVAAALPEDARIERVRLTLSMLPSNEAPRSIGLHRLLAGWGEGASFASGGGGAPSGSGDATWLHRFYDDRLWVKQGGHFVARASSILDVAGAASYTWEGTPKMLSDVRMWHLAPQRNFGWILLGDEKTPQNVKAFASREEPNPSLQPVLEVTYRPRGR